jgi:hypothetical protein
MSPRSRSRSRSRIVSGDVAARIGIPRRFALAGIGVTVASGANGERGDRGERARKRDEGEAASIEARLPLRGARGYGCDMSALVGLARPLSRGNGTCVVIFVVDDVVEDAGGDGAGARQGMRMSECRMPIRVRGEARNAV